MKTVVPFSVWCSQRKNTNTRVALELRAKGDFKQGLVYLKKACSEGDGEALFLVMIAFKYGGWGLHQDLYWVSYFKKLCKQSNCPWYAMHYANREDMEKIAYSGNEYAQCYMGRVATDSLTKLFWINCAVESGCATALCQMGHVYADTIYEDRQALHWYLKAADQKHAVASKNCATFFRRDHIKCALYTIQSRDFKCIRHRIIHAQFEDELYLYGESCDNFTYQTDLTFERIHLCKYIQSTTDARVCAAVLFWMWCSKHSVLCKDIRVMIGKLIWKSRYQPQDWGVFISDYQPNK